MKERNGPQSLRRRNGAATGIAAVAAFAVLLVAGFAGLLAPPVVQSSHWAAINLNFGPNPVTESLQIQFARVSWIDQPMQYNTTGFAGSTLVGNGSFLSNASSYGEMQFNTTTGNFGSAVYPISGNLGSNVSYLFAQQRVALNGTAGHFTFGIFQVKPVTAPPTTGNVTNANAGGGQNMVWVQGTSSGTNYTLKVDDWEEQHGGFQTLTTTTINAALHAVDLVFFNVLIWVQKTQAVVSFAYTNNATVFSSTVIHPVMSGNLSKAAYLADTMEMSAGGANAAMIVDKTYFVDHNAFVTAPASPGAVRGIFSPADVGALPVDVNSAPFDPAAIGLANDTTPSASTTSFSNVNVSTSAFTGFVNSSATSAKTSSRLNSSLVVTAKTGNISSVFNTQALTTLRANPEAIGKLATATLVITSWTPQTIAAQISAFLTGYIGSQNGIPASQVIVTSYTVQRMQIVSTFSTQAAQAIHDFLSSAIPGFLAKENLALVNPETGAVDAGADLGMFLTAAGVAKAPVVLGKGEILDPVNGKVYGGPVAAGFPDGSTISASGAIAVPGQAAFLGWSAEGLPEFGPGGCFIVCTSSLSGAASAVSNFFGSAASSVANAVTSVPASTLTGAVQDVIQPVASSTATLGTDVSNFASDVSGAVSQVLPFAGGTIANVGYDVGGTLTNTLSSATGTLASVASGTAGALLSGVNSVTNTLTAIGPAAGSAAASIPGIVTNTASGIVNTVGKFVNDSSAVLSPFFASTANLLGTVATSATSSLASLGSAVASAGMSALDDVGSVVSQAAGGAWNVLTSGFGQLGHLLWNATTGALGSSATAPPLQTVFGFGNTSSLVLEIIIIVLVVVVILVAALWLWHRHRKHRGTSGGKSRRAHRRPKAA